MIKRLLKRFFCKHNLVWDRNIHGDEINAMNGQRSWWTCDKCDNSFTKSKLVTKVEDDTMNQYDMICDSIEKLSRYDYDDDGVIAMCNGFLDGRHKHTELDIKYMKIKHIPYPTCNQHEYTNACLELLHLCRILIRGSDNIRATKDGYALILFYIKEIEKTEPYLKKMMGKL